MLHQLKKIFPSLIPYTSTKVDGYMWFLIDDNEPIGIHEKDVSKKDVLLLNTFLEPYHPNIPIANYKAKKWQQRINEPTDEVAQETFRFIYFLMSKNQIDPEVFQEALNELFHKEIPIIWFNEVEGIFIEPISLLDPKVNYDEFIHVLIADLSVNIRFYIGETRNSFTGLKAYYDNILNQVPIVFSSTNKEVVYYAESIGYLLLHRLSIEEKECFLTSILKDFKNDPEMLQTLNVFFESNLNISETAKKMYMHRNSVQYRLDKYINETGINIQRFNEAISVKIALLIKE